MGTKFVRHKIRPNGSAEFRVEGTTFRMITGRKIFGGNPPPQTLEVSLPEGYEHQIATADAQAKAKQEAKAAKLKAREDKKLAKEEKKAEKLKQRQEAAQRKEEAKRAATEAARAAATDVPPQPSI